MLVYIENKEVKELNDDYIELITPYINNEEEKSIDTHHEYAYVYEYFEEEDDDVAYEVNIEEYFIP